MLSSVVRLGLPPSVLAGRSHWRGVICRHARRRIQGWTTKHLGETTLRAEKEGRQAPLRAGDGIPQGRVVRPRSGLRRGGAGPIPLQRRPRRLLARARLLGALEEEGTNEGALRIPRP